jgi:hypothetical protein
LKLPTLYVKEIALTTTIYKKYIPSTQVLGALALRAERLGLNRQIDFATLVAGEKFPLGTKFPILWYSMHNEEEVRIRFGYNSAGDSLWLDMTLPDFTKLPSMKLEAEALETKQA